MTAMIAITIHVNGQANKAIFNPFCAPAAVAVAAASAKSALVFKAALAAAIAFNPLLTACTVF